MQAKAELSQKQFLNLALGKPVTIRVPAVEGQSPEIEVALTRKPIEGKVQIQIETADSKEDMPLFDKAFEAMDSAFEHMDAVFKRVFG